MEDADFLMTSGGFSFFQLRRQVRLNSAWSTLGQAGLAARSP
jgi:hypothetical protein